MSITYTTAKNERFFFHNLWKISNAMAKSVNNNILKSLSSASRPKNYIEFKFSIGLSLSMMVTKL